MKTGYSVDENTKHKLDRRTKPQQIADEARESAETIEEVKETGHDNPKRGAKAVKEVETKAIKEREAKKNEYLTKLDSKKRFRNSYDRMLAQTVVDSLQMLDWIHGWRADVVVTDGSPITLKSQTGKVQHHSTKPGILLIVTTPNGRVMHQGIMVCGDPVLDYAAMQTLAIITENQMDKERGLLLDSEGDSNEQEIYLPNGEPKSNRNSEPAV